MPKTAWTVRPAALADIDALVALRANLLDGASEASYVSRTHSVSSSAPIHCTRSRA